MGLTRDSVGLSASGHLPEIKRRNKNDRIIALAGNPNVGKSTIFNELTGLHQHTGNWPGKTIINAQGFCEQNGHGYVIVDIPGTYSLMAHSAEEEVARDFICSNKADVVVVVCDSTCLERNIPLVLQILEITSSVVVCLNLIDEARKKGVEIDSLKLASELGVAVVETSARNGIGIEELIAACENTVSSQNNSPQNILKQKTAEELIRESEQIYLSCLKNTGAGYTKRERIIDKILTNKIFAFPIMLFLLASVFWLTIEGANYPSEILSRFLFGFEEPLRNFLSSAHIPNVAISALVDGAWHVLAWVVAVMLPPMAIFFPLFTILEDFGFLPRIAFNLDNVFKKCNACGKQSLTMCMGFGCNAAGVVGCRIIDSPRERILAILTNSFVPCNGRFPALITLISVFLISGNNKSSVLSAIILIIFVALGVIMTFLASKLLSATVLKGVPSSFTLELPPYRRPQICKVIVHSIFDRTLFVLGRAAAVAAPAGLMLWFMANVTPNGKSLLLHCSDFLSPFAKCIGLDGVILMAFILGFPANEIVVPIMIMAYTSSGTLADIPGISALSELLSANGWTTMTAICTCLFTLMHWPCSTTLMTIKKETQSIKWTIAAALLPTIFGMLTCAAFNFIAGLII